MVFAHRSFARATLVGSLFGNFWPALCGYNWKELVKPENNVLFSVLLFSKSVFVKSSDNPFSAAGAWPWSLRVATWWNSGWLSCLTLGWHRLARCQRPGPSVSTFTYNSTCHELTGKSHACSFWPCKLQQTFFSDPNRNLMILVQIICLKIQSRMTYADS